MSCSRQYSSFFGISAKALLSPVMLPCTSAPKATFQKTRDKKDRFVDTPAFTNKDEIALDYKLIQGMFGADCYNIYLRQEVFNRFLKNIALA